MLKFQTKSTLLGHFWARLLKNYFRIWNQHPRICLFAKFCRKLKSTKFRSESDLFGSFFARFYRNYCHIWNQHPQICIFAKFREKIKMRKFGIKKCLIWVFFNWNFKKVLSYLKSTPSNLYICKVSRKNKNA